jgi:F0F1-type ATP synthase assembly protein I
MLKASPVENFGGHPNSRQNSPTPFLRKAGLYVAIAFELPGTILGGLLVGYLLDNYLDTSPWLLIVVTATAFTGAMVRLVRWVKFLARERNGSGVEKDDTAH